MRSHYRCGGMCEGGDFAGGGKGMGLGRRWGRIGSQEEKRWGKGLRGRKIGGGR